MQVFRVTAVFRSTVVFLFLLGLTQSFSQVAPSQELYYNGIDEAMTLYGASLFSASKSAFDRFAEKTPYNSVDENFWAKAQTYQHLSDVKANRIDAEMALVKLAGEYEASPYGNVVYQELADFYLKYENYEKAGEYYDEIDYRILEDDLFSELTFKNAYAKFVTKKFFATKTLLDKVLPFKDRYYFPANYYYGMAEYFTDNPDDAITRFKELENSVAYKNRIPYLITQLEFNKGNYQEVIDYGSKRISNPKTKNIKEIRGLIGQSYFVVEDYENAIFHLGHYVANTEKLRAEDFYQLGFAYYQTGQYEKAVTQFVEIANEESELGQNANNYLAKSYINNGDRNAALAAFKRTANLDFIPGLGEEARFNYAKLSAELGYDREALELFKEFDVNSIYFAESQLVLSKILNNTKDYERAIQYMDEMEMQSPLIQETYQRISYLYGMQFMIDQDFRQAEKYFLTSLKRPVNNEYTALANFRMATVLNQDLNYQASADYMNRFLSLANAGISFPQDVNMGNANYIQGYNYLKQKDFVSARGYLSNAADAYASLGKPKLQMDALLRAADCYFRINNYEQAKNLYSKGISLGRKGSDYALYQKGIIEGLQGKPFEKMVTLDKLIEKYPSSSLAEFALFQNAETLLAMNEPSEARRAFNQILRDYETTSLRTRILLKLGLISYNQGNNNDAIRYYKDLFNHNPNSNELQEAIIALEEIYVESLGQPDEFFDFVEKKSGIKINEFEKDSLSYKAGAVPYENGEYDKAIRAYSNYVQRYPEGFNIIEAYYKRGESFLNLRRYEEALNDYEFVIGKGANDYYLASLHKSAVIAFYQVKDYSKAFDYYSLLEEIESDEVLKYEAQLGAMMSAMEMEDTEALQYMSERILESPNVKMEDAVAAHSNLAKIFFKAKDFPSARVHLAKLIGGEVSAISAEAQYMLASIEFEEGKLELADSRIRQFIIDYKSYPRWVARNLILLSDVLVKKEDLLQARAAIEAVVENYSGDEEISKLAQDRLAIVLKMEEERNRIDAQQNDGQLILEKENEGQND